MVRKAFPENMLQAAPVLQLKAVRNSYSLQSAQLQGSAELIYTKHSTFLYHSNQTLTNRTLFVELKNSILLIVKSLITGRSVGKKVTFILRVFSIVLCTSLTCHHAYDYYENNDDNYFTRSK